MTSLLFQISPVNGDVWLDASTNSVSFREHGITKMLDVIPLMLIKYVGNSDYTSIVSPFSATTTTTYQLSTLFQAYIFDSTKPTDGTDYCIMLSASGYTNGFQSYIQTILHGDGIAEMLQVYILLPQQQLILLQHQHFQKTPRIP